MKPGDTTQFGTVAKVFPFNSKTNPLHRYECLLYTNGALSCNCKGWTIARGGKRSCKHTELVEGSLADLRGPTTNLLTAATTGPRATASNRRFNLDLE